MVDGAPVPDTAMDTKSEDSVGGRADPTPLTEDERALLDRLREGDGAPAGPAAEDSPEYGAAVDAGSPVPTDPPGGTEPDPLDPIFREPTP